MESDHLPTLGRPRITNVFRLAEFSRTAGVVADVRGNLVARKYDGSKRRGPGRPPTRPALAQLVIRMASSNPTWRYTRIRGALRSLGHDLGRSTLKRILADAGIPRVRS